MWIDKLAIYKYDREYSEGKKKKPLRMQNHLINDEMMKISKFIKSSLPICDDKSK